MHDYTVYLNRGVCFHGSQRAYGFFLVYIGSETPLVAAVFCSFVAESSIKQIKCDTVAE